MIASLFVALKNFNCIPSKQFCHFSWQGCMNKNWKTKNSSYRTANYDLKQQCHFINTNPSFSRNLSTKKKKNSSPDPPKSLSCPDRSTAESITHLHRSERRPHNHPSSLSHPSPKQRRHIPLELAQPQFVNPICSENKYVLSESKGCNRMRGLKGDEIEVEPEPDERGWNQGIGGGGEAGGRQRGLSEIRGRAEIRSRKQRVECVVARRKSVGWIC